MTHKHVVLFLLLVLAAVGIALVVASVYVWPQQKQKPQRKPKSDRGARPPICYTLTTTPSRIHLVAGVVRRLLAQTVGADRIVINVPHVSQREQIPYEIPTELADLVSDTVRIQRCEDEGPLTKLLPTLEHQVLTPETLLIPVDDDVVLTPEFFEELVEFSWENLNTVVGYHGVQFRGPQWVFRWAARVEHVDLVETVAGAVYRRSMFGPDAADRLRALQQRHPSCWRTDDVVLGAYMAEQNVERTLLPGFDFSDGYSYMGHPKYPGHINNSAPNPLYAGNTAQGHNFKCMRALRSVF